VRPPSVVRTGISPAGSGLAGLLVQASAQPSRAETICSESSQTGTGAAGSEAAGAGRAHWPWTQVTRSALARPVAVATQTVLPDAAAACGAGPTATPAPVTWLVRGSMRSTFTCRPSPDPVTQTVPGAAASRPDPSGIEEPGATGGDSVAVAVTWSVRGSIRVTAAPSDAQTAPSPTATCPNR
jgi:hypothetical protein